MRRGRPVSELTLTTGERTALERWVRRPKTAQSLAQRARIVLACSQGKTNTAVAGEVGVTRLTVGKWRSRFQEQRLDGLLDRPLYSRGHGIHFRPGTWVPVYGFHSGAILTTLWVDWSIRHSFRGPK